MISKQLYKHIKSMNRQELDGYLSTLYAEGHNNGVLAMTQALTKKIDKGIRNTPGIGEKRYQDILQHITEELHKPDEEVKEETT